MSDDDTALVTQDHACAKLLLAQLRVQAQILQRQQHTHALLVGLIIVGLWLCIIVSFR